MGYFILFLAVAAFAFFIIRGRKAAGSPLRKKCLHELRLPPAEAERTLNRHLERLKNKHPGRDEDWYLEKILYDLGRDRR